jgi:hypothetical protein
MASNSDQDKSSKLAASWEHDQTYDTTWNNLMYRADIIWYAESSQSKFVYLCTIHIIHNLPCWDPLGQRPSDGAWRMHLLYLALAFHLFFSYIILYYIILYLQLPFNGHTAITQQISRSGCPSWCESIGILEINIASDSGFKYSGHHHSYGLEGGRYLLLDPRRLKT